MSAVGWSPPRRVEYILSDVTTRSYDSPRIHALLAHRYPFVLVDRVDVIEAGRRVVGTKRVTSGEWWAMGVPDAAMPFTLVIEALAQTSGAVVQELVEGAHGGVAYFMGADRVRFRRPARVGEELRLDVSLVQWRRGVCRMRGVATVEDDIVLTAELTIIVRSTT